MTTAPATNRLTRVWAACVTAGLLATVTQVRAAGCPAPDFDAPAVLAGTTSVSRGVLKATDYNGDGKADLAYLKNPSTIAVLIGSDGSFTPGPSVDVGVPVTDFTFVDLNRDGRMDLVVTNTAGLRSYLQRPDGSLGVFTLPKIPETLPGSTAAFGPVIAADFSRDGLPDLAVVNLGARRLEFYVGDATGVMTYQPPATGDHRLEGSTMWGLALGFDGVVPIAGVAEPGDRGSTGRVLVQGFWRFQSTNASMGALHGPMTLAAADLDGDGVSDWIVNERGDGFLSVYSKGTRTSSVQVSPFINEMAVGDFNADGKPDVVLTLDNGGLAIAAGDGRGGLQPLQRFGASFAASAVVAADFDQDGVADVAFHTTSGQVVLLTNRCAPDLPKVDAVAMDVVQTVNDLALSAPLVAGKRTFVRLHATSSVPLGGVSARLRGFGASGASLGPALAPINEQLGLSLNTTFGRQRVADGYLFELPAAWLAVGTLRLEGKVNDPTGIPLATGSSTTLSRTVDLLPAPALPVTVYDVTWRSKEKPAGNPAGASAEAVWLMSRQFPSPTISASVKAVDIAWDDGGFRLGPEFVKPLVDELDLTYATDPPGRSLAYFVIGAVGGGIVNRIGGSTGLGTSSVITHEVGHLLGLRHVLATADADGRTCDRPQDASLPPFPYEDGRIGGPSGDTQRFVGFDAGSIATVRPEFVPPPADVLPSATPETMAYCTSRHWFSDVSQRTMLQSITDRFTSTRALPLPMARASDAGPWLSLQASVAPEGDRLVGLRIRRFAAVRPAPEVSGDGYRLRFLDAAGQVVAETPFGSQPPLEGGSHRSISVVVRWPDGAVAFRLVHDASQAVLAERRVPAAAPRIRSFTVTPNAGRLDLRWTADGGSGRPMRHWLSYRPVPTEPWRPVVIDLPQSAVSVALDRIEGTHGAATGQFRLQALDELDAAEAVSAPFSVPGKAPVLSIASPANGVSLRPGQSLMLQAAAWDADDGALPAAAITWVSDRDGLVGSGGLVSFSPRASGLHRLTASVVDSDGQRTTQQRLVDASGSAGTLVSCIVTGRRIEALGGQDLLGRTWRRSIDQAAGDIRAGAAYTVASTGGSSARIAAVRTRRGTTYLRAVPSRGLGDNLRGLPACSAG